jgi:hypothetical protein
VGVISCKKAKVTLNSETLPEGTGIRVRKPPNSYNQIPLKLEAAA